MPQLNGVNYKKHQKKVVTLICDTGNKYLSKAYNKEWLEENF
jgi:cysteine synthase